MLAMLLTLTFLAAAVMAVAVISASLAKGFAAATGLRRQLALCSDLRIVTVGHEHARVRAVATARSPRRPVRQASLVAIRARQRVAA